MLLGSKNATAGSGAGLEAPALVAGLSATSLRDQLVFAIGFTVSRGRDLLRRILREHTPDDARRQLTERVVQHLERSGFELDEEGQALKKRPPRPPHST